MGTANCDGIFYSYNQEAAAPFDGEPQNVVSEVVARLGGFTALRRDPSWLRRGYVEEVYRFGAPPRPPGPLEGTVDAATLRHWQAELLDIAAALARGEVTGAAGAAPGSAERR